MIYSQLAFVVGADQLAQLATWYRFPEILGLSHWIILERKPNGSKAAREALQVWENSGLVRQRSDQTWESQGGTCLMLAPTEAQEISSTAIRECLARTGTPPADTLLPEVFGYLKKNRLYGI